MVAVFLAIEVVVLIVYWGAMLIWPSIRSFFVPDGARFEPLLAFAAVDASVVVIAVVTAVGSMRKRAWARLALWLHLGVVFGATVWTFSGWALGLVTWAATLAMAMMSAWAMAAVWIMPKEPAA